MVPPEVEGTVLVTVADGEYTIDEPLVRLELPNGEEKELTMTQHWPIRTPRPTHHRFPHLFRLLPDSVSSIPCSRSQKAVLLPSQVDSEPERQ